MSRLRPDRSIRCRALLAFAALAPMVLATPVAADGSPRHREGFRGAWASDAHCRWPDIFMFVYDRTSVDLPHGSLTAPALSCRIVRVSGRRPEWRLRLSCQNFERPELANKRFEVRQLLKLSADGDEMLIETEPFLHYPARREETRYCRGANDPQPPLICFDAEKGHSYPCEP